MKINLENFKRSEGGTSRYVPKGSLKKSDLLTFSYQKLDEMESENSKKFHSRQSSDKEKRIAEVNVGRIRRRKRALQKAGPFSYAVSIPHDDTFRYPRQDVGIARAEEHLEEEYFYKMREEQLKEIRKVIRETQDVEIKIDIKDDGWWIEFLKTNFTINRTHVKSLLSEAEVRQILRSGTAGMAERLMKVILHLNPPRERKK